MSPDNMCAPAALQVIECSDEHTILNCLNLFLVVWAHWPDPEACRWLGSYARNLAHEIGVEKVSTVSVCIPVGQPPSRDAREALAELHRETQTLVHRSAIVMMRQGLIAAGIRGHILNLLPRAVRRTPQTVFHRLDRAIEWAIEGLILPDHAEISVPLIVQAMQAYLHGGHADLPRSAIAG